MTVRLPGLTWNPLLEADRQPRIVPTQLILHTVVGHANPYRYFNREDITSESHGWVDFDGGGEQFISLDRSADANYRANRRPDGTGAISIETQDYGPALVQETRWSEEQLDRLAAIAAWCASPDGLVAAWQSVHGTTIAPIPLRRCTSPTEPGVGYHSMFGAPSEWTNARGKTCPGAARIAQFDSILERALLLLNPTPRPSQEDDLPDYTMSWTTGHQFAFYPSGKVRWIAGEAEFKRLQAKSIPDWGSLGSEQAFKQALVDAGVPSPS